MSAITNTPLSPVASAFIDAAASQIAAEFRLFARMAFTCGSMSGGCFTPSTETWTASMSGEGRADIQLGDGYSLEINEASSQILIHNEATGETTNIWGDPHVDWNGDGRTDADFWGTTTFTLENGTKITINTEPWGKNPNAFVASQVVITKGSNAIIVDGVSQNQLGDLSITQHNDGLSADLQHRDGFTVHENPAGHGWINPQTGEMATQEDFNITKPGAQPQFPPFNLNFASALTTFLLLGSVDALYAEAANSLREDVSSLMKLAFNPDL